VARDNPYVSDMEPIALLELLSEDYDRFEWATWVPDALWDAIVDDYGSEPSDECKDMIGALRSLLASEAFWNEYHVFMQSCAALNGRVVDWSTLPELEPSEVMYAVAVAHQVRNDQPLTLPDGSKVSGVTYGDQVLATIAAVFIMAGLVYVPPPVEAANVALSLHLDKEGVALQGMVKSLWRDSGHLKSPPAITDDALRVQIEALFSIRSYLKDRFNG